MKRTCVYASGSDDYLELAPIENSVAGDALVILAERDNEHDDEGRTLAYREARFSPADLMEIASVLIRGGQPRATRYGVVESSGVPQTDKRDDVLQFNEELPTRVYLSDVGYFCIRQQSYTEGEITALIHPDRIDKVIAWLQGLVMLREQLIANGDLLPMPEAEQRRLEAMEETEKAAARAAAASGAPAPEGEAEEEDEDEEDDDDATT